MSTCTGDRRPRAVARGERGLREGGSGHDPTLGHRRGEPLWAPWELAERGGDRRRRQRDDERRAAAARRWRPSRGRRARRRSPATIASPRPAPRVPRSRPPSARQKRSNSASGSSVGRPGPWSRTSRRTSSPVARRRVTSIGVPAGVCTSALRSRLASTWRSWCGVAEHDRRVPSSRERDRAVGRGRARVVDGVARERGEVDRRCAARRRPRRAARASAGPRRARPCAPPRPRSGCIAFSTSSGSRAAPIRNSSA